MSDQELLDLANTWINTPSLQNHKTDQRSISFVANLLLQARQGRELTERQKDYLWAVVFRCSHAS